MQSPPSLTTGSEEEPLNGSIPNSGGPLTWPVARSRTTTELWPVLSMSSRRLVALVSKARMSPSRLRLGELE